MIKEQIFAKKRKLSAFCQKTYLHYSKRVEGISRRIGRAVFTTTDIDA